MTNKLVGVAGAVAVCLIGGAALAQPKPAAPAAPDFAVLAEKVVGTNVNIKEGQVVQVVAGPYDTALAEEIAVAARKRGAYVLITYTSEALAKKIIASVPAKYDTQARKLDLALAKLVDVVIVIPQVRDPQIMAALPADRALAMGKADQTVGEVQRKRNVRTVELGNGLEPTANNAKSLGISEAELKRIYWDGVTADYAAVEQKCTALKTALAAGKELKITHPNGTDITIAIKGKKVFTSDGVVSDADAKAGGPGVNVWLPAGEVYLVPGKATGKVVDDRANIAGKDITGITIDVKDGKATALTAKSGWEGSVPKGRYDVAGAGKNELSLIDFGCNSAIKADKLESFIPAGNVTLGFGGNLWAGGTNKEAFAMIHFLPGTTVLLDGKAIVENGTLK